MDWATFWAIFSQTHLRRIFMDLANKKKTSKERIIQTLDPNPGIRDPF
jgi:hypothetical protein